MNPVLKVGDIIDCSFTRLSGVCVVLAVVNNDFFVSELTADGGCQWIGGYWVGITGYVIYRIIG